MSTIMKKSAAEFWWGVKLPYGVAYLIRNDYQFFGGDGPKWKEVTYREILDKKIEKQDGELYRKRVSGSVVPGYVWVFYNSGFLMGGWYIYIKTLKTDYGINFRHDRNGELVERAMQMFPLGVFPLEEYFDEWAEKFANKFSHVGFKRKSNQGLAKCMCGINEYGKLISISSLVSPLWK